MAFLFLLFLFDNVSTLSDCHIVILFYLLTFDKFGENFLPFNLFLNTNLVLQCLDAVDWVSERATSL